MRIAEAFCKMRLSEYCSAQDIDRAIAVTVDSFIRSQKVSCKKALSRAFAKYVSPIPPIQMMISDLYADTPWHGPNLGRSDGQESRWNGRSLIGKFMSGWMIESDV